MSKTKEELKKSMFEMSSKGIAKSLNKELTPEEFLLSKGIAKPSIYGTRLPDNDMEQLKITDLMHEYAQSLLKQERQSQKEEDKKAFEAGYDFAYSSLSITYNDKPDFEEWYKQIEQKDPTYQCGCTPTQVCEMCAHGKGG